tara:strand:- start:242 stop:595 length:354 start_codon:yes stop_codon:yes gene_type:complete
MQRQKKAKVLRPTLREKKRYLVYDANYFGKKVPSSGGVKRAINESVLNFLGELGFGEAGALFVKGSAKKGVLRVDRKYVDHVKTGLMLVKKVDGQDAAVRCVGVSGNIKKAEEIMNI